MSENRASYPITVMCRTLGVSPSGYHAWVKRSPSSRAVTDAELTEKIRTAHTASKGTYGVPRIQSDLAEVGIRVGRKRVARLMRAAGLAGGQPSQVRHHDGSGRGPSGSRSRRPEVCC